MSKDDLLLERIYKNNTSSKPCVVQDWPEAKTVWLDVGSQHFCVTIDAVENNEEAEFMRRMLALALVNIIKENSGK